MYLAPRLTHLRRPAGLAGLTEAVARLVRAVTEHERVGIFGDYDVDGVTTTALLTSGLRQLGVTCVARVAHREAGYGFGIDEANALADAGCQLIVTGDCGTSDIEAITHAKQRGVDVIVVDHHTVPPLDASYQNPSVALVNPLRHDSTFPYRAMASVGLAFYLLAALRTELKDTGHFRHHREPDLRELLDLVALGTIADLVPLTAENRILTSIGLRCLAQRRRPGVAALMDIAGVGHDRAVDERTVSWRLGPRLNAPGRMGDAGPALELLLAEDMSQALGWANKVEQANEARRQAQDRVMDEALSTLGNAEPGPAVVVHGRGWPCGVVGIVASRLVEMYQRPSFVIAVDEVTGLGRGSARTWGDVNLYKVLAQCSERLTRFGGHAGAAGLTVQESELSGLSGALMEAVARSTSAVDNDDGPDGSGRPLIDAEVGLAEIDEQLCDELGRLSPFGKGNEAPLLACHGMRVRESRRVGATGSHLKLAVEDQHGVSLWGIAFGQGERDPGRGAMIDAAFAPTVSEWGGARRVELEIREFRAP